MSARDGDSSNRVDESVRCGGRQAKSKGCSEDLLMSGLSGEGGVLRVCLLQLT